MEMAPLEYRVTPHLPFPIENMDEGHEARIPPLLKAICALALGFVVSQLGTLIFIAPICS